MLITAILAWGHIISAISWLGGGIMFAFVVGPLLTKLSPASSGEFLVKVVPRVARFFQMMAGSTILFGVLLLYAGESNGEFAPLTFSTFYGADLTIGLSVGLIAFLMAELVAVPAQLKVVRMVKEMQAAGQQQPSAEFPKALRRTRITATMTVLTLILASVFMVAAGFY